MFFSLCCVCGKAEPSHMTVGPNIESALRKDGGASGAKVDKPESVMCERSSAFVFGHSFGSLSSSKSDPELSRGVLNNGSDDLDDDDVVEFAGDRPAMLLSEA
jgi:hypothetical protein